LDTAGDEKKGFRWKRTRHSQRLKQDLRKKNLKQADLKLLQQAAQDQHIELKYLDESGFCLWSPVSYSYSRIGVQKCLEQTPKRYGSRISILGLWQPDEHFEYALVQGGFKSASYIKVMDWVARLWLKHSNKQDDSLLSSRTTDRFTQANLCVNSGHAGKSRDYSFSFYLHTALR